MRLSHVLKALYLTLTLTKSTQRDKNPRASVIDHSATRKMPPGTGSGAKPSAVAPLFFRWRHHRQVRIPAGEEHPFADNFLQKQQKRRAPFEEGRLGKL